MPTPDPGHLMRKEILQQPQALQDTLEALLPLAGAIEALARPRRHVRFFARGSSNNAATYGRYLLEVLGGIPTSSGSPSVATLYGARVDLSDTVVVAISQSGQTEEMVGCLGWASRLGAATVAVTNTPGSPLANAADLVLGTRAGPERAVPATKTYTTQLLALAVLCLGMGGDLDAAALRRSPEEVERLIRVARAGAEEIAESLNDVERIVVCGRGFAVSTAHELSLKLQETCHMSAIGISGADLQHGPTATLDPGTPLLVIGPNEGAELAGLAKVAERARGSGSPVIAIGGRAALPIYATAALAGPELPDWLAPVGLIVPGQLLVEIMARRRGLDADTPRGLRKVTQTV